MKQIVTKPSLSQERYVVHQVILSGKDEVPLNIDLLFPFFLLLFNLATK